MIYGERLRLRAAEREDIPRFVAWLNDPEVRQYLLLSLPMSRAAEEHWYERMSSGPAAEQVLVIEIKEGEDWRPIGTTSLMGIDSVTRAAEVGLMIGEKDCWNQGYGREVMRTMLRLGFETLNLHRIFLRVSSENIGGIKAYEHAGFRHEGRQRDAEFHNGKYSDVLMMSVLSHEFV